MWNAIFSHNILAASREKSNCSWCRQQSFGQFLWVHTTRRVSSWRNKRHIKTFSLRKSPHLINNYVDFIIPAIPVSILYKSIADCYRPVRVADGPITARYRFIKNASWDVAMWSEMIKIITLICYGKIQLNSITHASIVILSSNFDWIYMTVLSSQ